MADLGNLNNLDDEKNWTVAVTDYQDFRKIVCAFINRMRPKGTTDEKVEKLIEDGGGETIMQAEFNKNKKDFA